MVRSGVTCIITGILFIIIPILYYIWYIFGGIVLLTAIGILLIILGIGILPTCDSLGNPEKYNRFQKLFKLFNIYIE